MEEGDTGAVDCGENDESSAPDMESEEVEINLAEIIPDPDQKAEPFFMINGKRVYKSTCLKAISNSEKLSKDRLRRVQGMSKYPGSATPVQNPESFLLIGDPVLVQQDGQPKIANDLKKAK